MQRALHSVHLPFFVFDSSQNGFFLHRVFCWCASELKTSSSVCLSSVWVETSNPLCPLPPPTSLQCVLIIQLSTGCIWPLTWCRGSFLMPPSFKTGSHSSSCPVTWPSYWRRTLTGWWMTCPTLLWPVSVLSLSGCPLEMTGNCHFFIKWKAHVAS